jgi:RNA polymerase sigma-70 factor (ECF subfamily)
MQIGEKPVGRGGNTVADKDSVEIERALIAEAQAGNDQAFEELVKKHSEQIYRMSLRLLKDPEDAKDNLQNALCKAYVNLAKFEGNSRFSTWLVRIAINEGLMMLRSRRSELAATRREIMRSDEDDQDEIARIRDARPSPERACIAKDLVAVAFRGVPPSLKEAFPAAQGSGLDQSRSGRRHGHHRGDGEIAHLSHARAIAATPGGFKRRGFDGVSGKFVGFHATCRATARNRSRDGGVGHPPYKGPGSNHPSRALSFSQCYRFSRAGHSRLRFGDADLGHVDSQCRGQRVLVVLLIDQN